MAFIDDLKQVIEEEVKPHINAISESLDRMESGFKARHEAISDRLDCRFDETTSLPESLHAELMNSIGTFHR